jgi:hypothetical protein
MILLNQKVAMILFLIDKKLIYCKQNLLKIMFFEYIILIFYIIFN